FLYYRSSAPLPLHSFPTRRSSDLRRERAVLDRRDEATPVLGPRHEGRGARGLLEERERTRRVGVHEVEPLVLEPREQARARGHLDRKSTRLNSSHVKISYAVFCLK